MRISRSPFGPGVFLAGLLCVGALSGRSAFGQLTDKPAPSPVAPGDLTKPMFDTTKRVYDQADSTDKSASTVIAEVEGRAITLGDIGDAIRALPPNVANLPFESLYPLVLEQLINRQALVVRAQQHGADEDPVIRRRMQAAADNALADEYAGREISRGITEAALLDRYNRDIAGHPGPEEVRVHIIMTGTEKEAEALIAEINGGADFATVARRSSKDVTAPAGGDTGFHARDGMLPEIGAVAFALPAGQMAPYPVYAVKSWFVVKTDERRREATPAFASVRAQLLEDMLREGVAPLTAASLNGLNIRRYGLTGKEKEPDKAVSPQ